MKRLLLLYLILVTALFISSCEETTTDPEPEPVTKGSVFITSVPSGAQIWFQNQNKGNTPDSIVDIEAGTYNFTLRGLEGYYDSTFSITVVAGKQTRKDITLVSVPNTVKYGPVRLWETTGTTVDQPSGLDLSAGTAYGIGSSSANRADVDIYYSSNGFVVTSADNASGLTRQTFFKVAAKSDLSDGADSPVKDASWTNNMGDRETNYVFLYDNDKNYSKIKIVNSGDGTPGNPAWVEVEWYYNKTVDDNRF